MERAQKDGPKQGMAILETETGKVLHFEKVQSFALSGDSQWIAYLHHKEEEGSRKERTDAPSEKAPESQKKKEAKKTTGSLLILRKLESGTEREIPHVLDYSFDRTSRYLAVVVASPEASQDGLILIDVNEKSLSQNPIMQQEGLKLSGLTWTEKGSSLAFLASGGEDENGYFSLWIWDGNSKGNHMVRPFGGYLSCEFKGWQTA